MMPDMADSAQVPKAAGEAAFRCVAADLNSIRRIERDGFGNTG
jgi:hypothetical protein